MAFVTNGSVHHEGVQNELDTVDALNKLQVFDGNVTPLGGTQHKADALIAMQDGVSIKRKKNIKTGSYDLLNTTVKGELKERFSTFINHVRQWRTLPEGERLLLVDTVRAAFTRQCEDALDSLTQSILTALLYNVLVTDHTDIKWMVITDVATSTLYVWRPEDHPAVRFLNEGFAPVLVKGRGKSSRKVVFLDQNGDVHDCGLRLRVVSNNGVKAFLGLSKANKNSSVVVKLQQDSVSKLMHSVSPKTYSF